MRDISVFLASLFLFPPIGEPCQVTDKAQTKAVGSAKKRFVRPVRLASGDLNMKTGGDKGLMSLDN